MVEPFGPQQKPTPNRWLHCKPTCEGVVASGCAINNSNGSLQQARWPRFDGKQMWQSSMLVRHVCHSGGKACAHTHGSKGSVFERDDDGYIIG